MNNYNLFDDQVTHISNFSGTYGKATLLFFSKSIFLKETTWSIILSKIKETPGAFQQLLAFCILPLLCNNKVGSIIDNRVILTDYFNEDKNYHIAGLLRNTEIDIQSLHGSPQQYLTNGYVQEELSSLKRNSKDYSINFQRIKNSGLNFIIENSLESKDVLNLISAKELYTLFFHFPDYETWSNFRDIHQKFYPEQHINKQELLNNIFSTFEEIYQKSLPINPFYDIKHDHLSVNQDIIKIFHIYNETQNYHFFEFANQLIQKQETNLGLKIVVLYKQINKILNQDLLKDVYHYDYHTKRSNEIISKPQGNIYELNTIEIMHIIKESEFPKRAIPPNSTELVKLITTAIDSFNKNEEFADNPLLNSLNFFSSPSHIDKIIVMLTPVPNISIENQEQFLIKFMTEGIPKFLFLEEDKFSDDIQYFLENELIESITPINDNPINKPKKF